uniref:LRRCT domain-containing protein n=1 Tax=Parastrongyloides trichosuri TaxID=131310 RepID=A0A0N4ZT14_PARTI
MEKNLLLLFYSILYLVNTVITGSKPRIYEQDPNSLYICKGQLGDYAACQCKEDEASISCINAQFVHTNLFHQVNLYKSNINKVTFHGNNFQQLPNSSLFGDTIHSQLTYLNISANYIMELGAGALKGMPNLKVLDLSNNEIVLKESDLDFLTFTPKLEEIYLRKAFIFRFNHSEQFYYLMEMFRRGNLRNLRHIDLSYNFLSSLPYNLPCIFPSIKEINLKQNLLETLYMNTSCLKNLETLDLSRNSFIGLDSNFTNFADQLPKQSVVLRCNFYCDCHSSEYIKWIRSTDVVREKNMLICFKASPRTLKGARIVEVPLHQLDCSVSLNITNSGDIKVGTFIYYIVSTFSFIFICFLF